MATGPKPSPNLFKPLHLVDSTIIQFLTETDLLKMQGISKDTYNNVLPDI